MHFEDAQKDKHVIADASVMTSGGETRTAGAAQGVALIVASFLPLLAIVALTVAVPRIAAHFAGSANPDLFVPVLVSAPGLSIALLSPFMGGFVDRYGRRPLLLWATGLYGLAGAAPFFLDSLPAIIASRLLLGVCESAILTVSNTLLADYYAPARRRRWLTAQGIFGTVGGTAVIPISGLLTAWRWNGVFLVYLIALAVFAVMAKVLYEPTRRADDTAELMGAEFPWRGVWGLALGTLYVSILYFVFIINGGTVFGEAGVTDPAQVGRYLGVASIMIPIGSLLYGALGARPVSVQLTVVLALLGIGLGVIGAAHQAQWAFCGLLVQQLGAGMTVLSLIAWAQSRFRFEHRGRGMGIWASSFFLGQFVSPILVNVARHFAGSMRGAFVVMGAVALTGCVVAAFSALRASQILKS
jgi:MFS family permease